MSGRPTRSQLAQKKSTEIFTGREVALDSFRKNLLLPLDNPDRKLIWSVTGQGGIGKTTLLNRFKTIAAEHGYLTARVDEYITPADIVTVMGTLSEQLERQGQRLKHFSERYTVFRQKKNEVESDPERPTGLAAMMGKAGGRIGVEILKQVPIAGGLAVGLMGEEALVEKGSEYASYLARRLGNKDEVRLVLDPVKELTPLFVQDISTLAQKQPVALLFDTYERTSDYLDGWLRDVLCGQYGELDVAVLLLIAGRYPLGQDWTHETLQPFIESIKLEPFSEAEARDYLTRKGITHPHVADTIVHLSGCIPVLLTTLASANPDDPDQIGDPTDQAIDRFLKWVGDSGQRQAVLTCALPRTLNRDVITTLVGAEQAQATFDFVRGMSFVSQNSAGQWVYHDVVRSLMLRQRRQESHQSWVEMHTRLADYHAAERDQLKLSLKDGLRDERWQFHNLEWLYHLICAREMGALDSWTACLVDTFDPGSPADYDRRLGETIASAGAATDKKAIVDRGNLIVVGMAAINSDEEQLGIPMLTTIITDCHGQPVDRLSIVMGRRGRAYAQSGNYPDALKDFSRAVELQPENGYNWRRRGRAHLEQKDYGAALIDFSRAIALLPEDGDNWFWRGQAHLEQKDYDAALIDFSRAIALQPEDEYNWWWRGLTQYDLKDYGAALIDFSQAIALQPKNEYNWFWRGRTQYDLKDYGAALIDFSQAIALQPKNEYNWFWRGRTQYDLKDYGAALIDFSRALELQPEDGNNWRWRGWTQYDLKDYGAALTDFSRAVELQPEDGNNWLWRGRAQCELKNYGAALTDFSRAVELQPEDGNNWLWRGWTQFESKNYTAALVDFSRAIELQPDEYHNWFWRGRAHYALKDYGAALTDFSRAVELQPEDENNCYWQGRTQYDLKDYPAALTEFSQAIALQPEDGDNWFWRGGAHYALKDYTAALTDFSRAIELDSENGNHWHWRGRAYYERKDYADALMDFSQVIKLQPEDGNNWWRRGRTHYELKDYAATLTDFNRAIALQPEDGYNWYWRGRTQYQLKDYGAALTDFSQAIELQPENEYNWYWRCLTNLHLGQIDQAAQDIDRSIQLGTTSSSHNQFWRAVITGLQQSEPDFQSLLEPISKADQDDSDVCTKYRILAKVALLTDRIEEARSHYTQALGDGCGATDIETEIGHLDLLVKLFPVRPAIAEVRDWLTAQITPKA